MIRKTRGIVLHNVNYGDSSYISKIYTRDFGMQSYIINGVRKGKGGVRPSHMLPLSILEMVIYHKENAGIQRIREVKCDPPLFDIHHDIFKNSVAMFISEILSQSIGEEETNERLYDFLEGFIHILDLEKGALANYPSWFLINFSRHLGFAPGQIPASEGLAFSMERGVFADELLIAGPKMNVVQSQYLSSLLSTPMENLTDLDIPKPIRQQLMDDLLEFYDIQILHGRKIRSHEVLKTLFV